MFQKRLSPDEMEERNGELETEIEMKRKELMLAELNKKSRDGSFWKRFSSDGTKKGISWEGIKSWLKTH